MGVKIKHRDPKTTDFSRDDVVINFNEGSLFFKSKLGLHKVTATQVNVGSENNIIGIGGPDEVLFNNGGVIGGDIGFRIRPYSLTTVGGSQGYSQTNGGTFADDNVLDVDLPFITRKGMFFGIGSNPTENVLSGGSYLGLDQRVAIGGARGTIPNVGNIFQTGEMCLMIKNGTGHLILGPQEGNISSAYGLGCHYETDRTYHMFNKPIVTMGNMISSFTNPLITTSQPLYITTDASTSTGMGHAFIEVSNTTSGLPPHVKVYGNLAVDINGTAPGIVYANQLHANGTDSRVVVLRSETTGKAIKTTSGINGDVEFAEVLASSYASSSDKKLKKNIKPLENSLSKILQLKGVNFEWKKSSKKEIQHGLIAQEVQKIIPELVTKEEHLRLNYDGIIPVLVEAIKEQQKQIEELKNKLDIIK